MSEKQRQGNLDDQYWRWHVIRECRVPDTYTRNGKKVRVVKALVKAVLLDLAKWGIDQSIFEGRDSIAHNTQIPVRTVSAAFRVLVENKIIIREDSPFAGATKTTRLDWVKIESLREKLERNSTPAAEPEKNTKKNDSESTAPVIRESQF